MTLPVWEEKVRLSLPGLEYSFYCRAKVGPAGLEPDRGRMNDSGAIDISEIVHQRDWQASSVLYRFFTKLKYLYCQFVKQILYGQNKTMLQVVFFIRCLFNIRKQDEKTINTCFGHD